MANGIRLEYKNVSPEAKQTIEEIQSLDNLMPEFASYTKNLARDDMELVNYGNPVENYQCLLDGNAVVFPDDIEDANIAFWSCANVSAGLTIDWVDGANLSMPGMTFTFDKFNDIYPTYVNVEWYQVDENGDIQNSGREQFYPTSGVFYIDLPLEAFSCLQIYFGKTNIENTYKKVFKIDFGEIIELDGLDIKNAEISQSIDPVTTEIPVDTLSISIDAQRRGKVYEFQERQPINIYFNDVLRGAMFLKSAQRQGQYTFDIEAQDYKGLLAESTFKGDRYINKSAFELIDEILTNANIPYIIESNVEDKSVTGLIQYTTTRDALMQVCFAIQAVIDTSGSANLVIKNLNDDTAHLIPRERIATGQSFTNESKVTSVEVSYHMYGQLLSGRDELYNADESGTGTEIEIIFSQPYTQLSITNGTIIESSANYAIIDAYDSCVLKGYQLWHTEIPVRKDNPKKKAAEPENVISINSATLVSKDNIDDVLEKCYNYLVVNNAIQCNIIEGKTVVDGGLVNDEPVSLGDVLEVETEYLGTQTKRLISQSFSLNGNILSKECELR